MREIGDGNNKFLSSTYIFTLALSFCLGIANKGKVEGRVVDKKIFNFNLVWIK